MTEVPMRMIFTQLEPNLASPVILIVKHDHECESGFSLSAIVVVPVCNN